MEDILFMLFYTFFKYMYMCIEFIVLLFKFSIYNKF